MFPRSAGMKAVNGEWHRFRQEARQNAYSIEEFGPDERVKYNLDTARITGRENPDTYRYDPAIDLLGIDGRLVTELPRHE